MTEEVHCSLQTRTQLSPVGELTLVAGPGGLRAVLWQGEDGTRVRRALTSPAVGTHDPQTVLSAASAQLDHYFAGRLLDFDLPLDPVGTLFQLAAWEQLRAIPFGESRSYRDQAIALGQPTAARAVGAANRANPLSIVVPCHRVLATSGQLTGFAGGIACKQWLLDHELQVRGQLVGSRS